MEITATARRLEALKEDGEMALETRFHLGDDVHGAWRDMARTEVVTRLSDEKFAEIEKIYEETGGDAQLVRMKAEANMTHQKGRTHEREN